MVIWVEAHDLLPYRPIHSMAHTKRGWSNVIRYERQAICDEISPNTLDVNAIAHQIIDEVSRWSPDLAIGNDASKDLLPCFLVFCFWKGIMLEETIGDVRVVVGYLHLKRRDVGIGRVR